MQGTTDPDQRDEEDEPTSSSDEMARADVANGERPEQPVSDGHSAYERERTDHHPVGEGQADTNRSEESPS